MAELTQIVCDGCGQGATTKKGPVDFELLITYKPAVVLDGEVETLKFDLHSGKSCAKMLVRTKVVQLVETRAAS